MVGYHREPALTAASFTDDGFFRTGDLGERSPTGQLRLTGRLKEPFKTSTGKYVAPAPIEALLQADPMIELAVVTGAGQPAPFALVMLSESWRTRLAASGGAGASGAAERGTATAESDAARETAQRALAERLRQVNAGLAPHERLRMLVVMPGEAWSVANQLLTPTLKPRRALIERAESDQLASWFRQPGPVLWA
jgi:long-chain acyl-CoA synthetase